MTLARTFGVALALSAAAITAAPGLAAPAPQFQRGAPAPAVEAGGTVTDRDGVVLGPIRNLVEDAYGEMHAVVQVDGRLVTINERALKWDGVNAVSVRSKAEILAEATRPQAPARPR
jgi:hypothetical protein